MGRLSLAVTVVLLCVVAGGGPATAATAATPVLRVPCADVIGTAPGPRAGGYRLVLGVLSVPPAYARHGAEPLQPRAGRWTHFHKAGLVVRRGRLAVTVTVPKARRARAAIAWGNGHRIAYVVRFSGCRDAVTTTWNAYAGGFFLRSAADCVPLVVRAGGRTTTVRFGIGRRCP